MEGYYVSFISSRVIRAQVISVNKTGLQRTTPEKDRIVYAVTSMKDNSKPISTSRESLIKLLNSLMMSRNAPYFTKEIEAEKKRRGLGEVERNMLISVSSSKIGNQIMFLLHWR